MVGAGGAIINYLFPGARGAPESKGAENIVSMEDIRLEQGLHEECGVFGIYDPEGSCAQTTYYGLYALQHRGQEACGIAAINDREQSFYKDVGLVSEVFDRETLQRLNGTMAVGHVRYATTGAGARENAQPLTIKYVKGTLAVVHNGNLGDVDRLRQVFVNIIDNALKYTSPGGTITVSSREDSGWVRVSIRDTGCGIPAEHLPNVKKKFYKANQLVRGSGIGLAVADEIARLHGGSLDIQSQEGVGTTVTISLPTCSHLEADPQLTETPELLKFIQERKP